MYNKKTLSKASAELDKAKAPKKPKDIITDPMGQWKYPGLPTRIPSNDITMKGVGYPVLGVANNGQRKIMLPGADYTFPGADYVDEYPQMRKGGAKKKKTKSLSGTNKLMLTHPLLQNYKNKVYDPNVDYFQDGGEKDNIIYPPGDSEYMDQPSYNYDIIEMLKQKARRGYEEYMHDQTDPTNINRTSPAYQQKFQMREGLIQAQKGGTSKSKNGTITNVIEKPDGSKIVQVKTKDGKYFEKVIPNNKYISPLTGKPYVPMQGDATIPSGWEAEDNTLEDISEFIDPTGITSWDDVARAYDENGLFHPQTGLEILGALPLIGKIGKSGKILAGGEKLFLDAVKYFGYNDKIANAYKAYIKMGGKNLDKVLGLTTKGLTKLSPKLNPEKWESSMKLINGLNKFTEGAKVTKLLPYTPSGDTQTKNDEDYIETELTDDEIEEYRKGGYIVEDISVPELNQAQEGIISTKEHTDKKGNKTIKVQKEDGTVYTKVIGKDGKVYNRTFDPKKDSWATDQTKDLYSKPQGAGNYADEFFTEATLLPGTVKGVKAAAPLVKQGLKTLMTAAPAWAPGANLGNFLTAAGGVMGVNEYIDPNSDVRKATKKAYQNPTVNNMTDAIYENTLNALNFSGFGAGAKVKNLKNYLNPKYSKASQIENTFMPNTLIQHPDNSYVLQNNSVKDFGITPEIKNLPTKDVHKFEVTKDEVKQLIDQNLEYLMHPNYIKRRQAVTGESTKKIEKEINKYVENLKKTTIDLNNARYGKKGYGAYLRSLKLLGIPLTKPKILINSSDKFFKTKSDVLHVLDHEIKHALSPVVESDFKALPKYKNYPHLNLVDKKTANSKYHSADHEQQVRFLRMKDYLHNKYGISKQEPISPEDWDLFKNDWNNWLKEEHIVAGNKKVPRGMSDIKGMMELKDPKVTSDALRNLVNKAWVAAPATGMLLMQNSQNKKQKGGVVAELSDDEIQDYINQGYIVEEV